MLILLLVFVIHNIQFLHDATAPQRGDVKAPRARDAHKCEEGTLGKIAGKKGRCETGREF